MSIDQIFDISSLPPCSDDSPPWVLFDWLPALDAAGVQAPGGDPGQPDLSPPDLGPPGLGPSPSLGPIDLQDVLPASPAAAQVAVPVPPGHKLFAGGNHRSRVHIAHARAARAAKCRERNLLSTVASFDGLARAWNATVLRHGDSVAEISEQVAAPSMSIRLHPKLHPNSFTTDGMLRMAFSHTHSSAQVQGIASSTRAMAAASVVVAACESAQAAATEQLVVDVLSGKVRSFLLCMHFDATPQQVRFGELSQQLAPSARYLVPALDARGQRRWRSVRIDEYRQLGKVGRGGLPNSGVVELLGQLCSIHFDALEQGLHVDVNWDLLMSPRILERCNSSTLFSAVFGSGGITSVATLLKMSVHVRFIIVQQCPDMVSSNIRASAHLASLLPRNIFHTPDFCSAHRLHRIIAAVSQENKLAGDVHAITYSCTITGNHEKMLQAWHTMVESGHCQRFMGEPCDEWRDFSLDIWLHTKARQHAVIRSAVDGLGESLLPSSELDVILDKGRTFLCFWNGDPRITKPTHWCTGPSQGI